MPYKDAQSNPSKDAHISSKCTKYQLKAIVTHLGRNSGSGHYVCHLRSDATEGKWLHFNDAKVTEVASLPKHLGYLYLYEQIE